MKPDFNNFPSVHGEEKCLLTIVELNALLAVRLVIHQKDVIHYYVLMDQNRLFTDSDGDLFWITTLAYTSSLSKN